VWRSNVLGSSGKGHEYFLKHLLGATGSAVRADESPPELRPRDVVWREQAPEGKLDLLMTIDFRMTSNCLFSDVVLPAATWYEKYDLSSTDLHPFVNSFNQAVPPPWEAKSDWDAFHRIAKEFSRLAERHLGVRRDLVAGATVPSVLIQSHSAPLGIAFYTGTMFPAAYRGNAFVALHGSIFRSTPTGYKVVRLHLNNGQVAGSVQDFATGWLVGSRAWGRPTDVLTAADGSLFISDDSGGIIYRIFYAGG